MKKVFLFCMLSVLLFSCSEVDNKEVVIKRLEETVSVQEVKISEFENQVELLLSRIDKLENLMIEKSDSNGTSSIQEVKISELENRVELLLSRIDKLENLMIEKSDSNGNSTVEEFTGYAELNEEIFIDLNCDGEKELVYYTLGDFKINGISFKDIVYYKIYDDNPHKEKYVIVDIDIKDNQKEIGIMVEGPSSDYKTYFFSYDGENVYEIGNVPFLIDNVEHQIDGKGIIYGHKRLSLLQTWFANATWELQSGRIDLVEPELYDVSHDRKHNLLVSLPLYESIGDETSFKTIDPQVIRFLQTDNKNWIKLECEDGTSGWFKIESFYLITDLGVYADQVFDALSFAD